MKNPKLQKTISVIQSVLLNKAYIALGTNIGNWKNNFNQSFKMINKLGLIKKFSSFYLSYPYGYKDQNYFYNTAIELETNLEPNKLFDELQLIEKKLQKNKPFLNGPRRIDLDIIFFNKLVLTSNLLTIPHKSAYKRDFVLLPLIEISPFFVHPTKKVPIKKLQKNIKKNYVFKVIRRQQESLVIY